jgi:YidC/Oxa1 family membrane protein insertase
MEDRRFILALTLSLAFFFAYTLFFAPPPRPRTPSPSPATITPTQASATPQSASTPDDVPAKPLVPVSATEETRVEVRTRVQAMAFTNRGARLLWLRMQRYSDARGNPEELVAVIPGALRALDIVTGDPAIDDRIQQALFETSRQELMLQGDRERGEIEFSYVDPELAVTKTLRFGATTYLIEIKAAVRWQGRDIASRLVWGPGIGVPTDAERAVRDFKEPGAVVLNNRGVKRFPASLERSSFENVLWAGVEGRYFAALFLAERGLPVGESWGVEVTQPRSDKKHKAVLLAVPAVDGLKLYVGPIDHQELEPLGHRLKEVVPVGDWIGPIVVPLMRLLRWVNGHVGNYGWSIVLLTLLINLVMAPLRHYSVVNSIKMSKMAPEMRLIQERYRKLPMMERQQKMQPEMNALYARHGLSMGTQMAVGCVPMLLTMPFLFAFYRVLQVSIDLRGAPFLWISDLSQKDPLLITPVLMGLSIFIMQRITPSTMDPAQQRMMMLMPLILVVFFFAAPAGLNLYWLASNVCTIAQQALTMRVYHPQAPAGARTSKR